MTESKQAMQNTIKNLQAKSDYISKLEDKGSKTIVLQFGSHTIKMGYANEKAPYSIMPFIAYKKKYSQPNERIIRIDQQNDRINYEFLKTQYHQIEDQLKAENIIIDNRTLKGKPRAKQLTFMNRITNFNSNVDILYGQQALWVEHNPNYIFRKLIKYGYFNTIEQNQIRCFHDIENLISYMMRIKMKIMPCQWNTFNCILILPDVFIRQHIKLLLQMLFSKIGFKKIYPHLESIMACFGTAVSSACIIDIGHEKINICCVDQGIILPKTLIRKNFGSKDISKILSKIFNDKINNELINKLYFNCQSDLIQIDQIKQIACATRQSQQTFNKIYQIYPIRNSNLIPLQISYTNSICVASNSFFSNIWNSFKFDFQPQEFNYNSKLFDLKQDHDDYFEEFSGGGHIYEIDSQGNHPNLFNPFIYQPLEDMILLSLKRVKDHEIRKKFMANILVVGGGGHMHKMIDEIILRINAKNKNIEQFDEKADIATDLFLREIAPIHASWLGGTVVPKLDFLRDLWIEKNKFIGNISSEQEQQDEQIFDKKLFTRKDQSQEWGIRYMKEKVPFLW